ncbi:hypothetical protein PIB30_114643, partial [Stylosanthes scabra]|nr:hypothetical protein [Stylosanthes scabra]
MAPIRACKHQWGKTTNGWTCAAKRGTRAGLALHLLGVLLVLVIRRGGLEFIRSI